MVSREVSSNSAVKGAPEGTFGEWVTVRRYVRDQYGQFPLVSTRVTRKRRYYSYFPRDKRNEMLSVSRKNTSFSSSRWKTARTSLSKLPTATFASKAINFFSPFFSDGTTERTNWPRFQFAIYFRWSAGPRRVYGTLSIFTDPCRARFSKQRPFHF